MANVDDTQSQVKNGDSKDAEVKSSSGDLTPLEKKIIRQVEVSHAV